MKPVKKVTFSIAMSTKTLESLAYLVERYGENRSRVICRLVDQAYWLEKNTEEESKMLNFIKG